jgi:hypothetical protein
MNLTCRKRYNSDSMFITQRVPKPINDMVPIRNVMLIDDDGEYSRHPNPGNTMASMLIATIEYDTHGILPTEICDLISEFTAHWIKCSFKMFKTVPDIFKLTFVSSDTNVKIVCGSISVGSRPVRNVPTVQETVPFIGLSYAGHVLPNVLHTLIAEYLQEDEIQYV